ncbi:MAG: tRNA (adenosine(37)-N6)-threonylcarbamoyltransferase complex dimerization subunit type 1 TsaB [Salinivirgaceae bacterium]|nr:tRNA (adenosine(37)-N6)-threonylcarbamoyltransferase complex dimerization subunit type 1 TsaB [Salinivirgaceae bacterium]MDD4745901.1 tRNA (adenosine(37)-N6)-threonylcarbamoyltransferase complex dimerization subunit type 1 TsaB [Salinivirgaceae bacterium]MDY0278966.1 tRNA (adenosine(37)-N6)-threonylcarbamoyltransferase complex dimerization subunit type 1 TsaB [Salinivirgaceae bacterium]
MEYILCIETATTVCSVALFGDKKLITLLETEQENAHSKTLTVFMETILKENNLKPKEINYIAVSNGPGSYTGLRIGVSAAKGFCFGTMAPLILIPTTEIIAQSCIEQVAIKENDAICPMIDARRMEVYHAIYNSKNELQNHIEPHIITEDSYADLLAENTIHFCGNGAFKLKNKITHPNAKIHTDIQLTAKFMVIPALKRIKIKEFANLAYDEPLYLKEFQAKQSKPYF